MSFDPDYFDGTKPLPDNNKTELPEGTPLDNNWKTFLVTKEPPDDIPLIQFYDTTICTAGNHSLIVGKKKSRKTLFMVYLISQYKGDIETDILYVDTEQCKKHVWKTRDRIYRMTGKKINILALRGLGIEDRRKVIEQAMSENNFKLVVIDGVRDLVSNINDPDQCTDLVTWIEAITVPGPHVCNILHLNKTDSNPRGHIGSELLNKAEVTIELELDTKAGCTLVKCESSRDIPFESFAFTHDIAGLPEIVSIPIKGQALSEYEQKERLQFVFEGEQLKYSNVIEGIMTHFEVGKSKADKLLGHFSRIGWVMKNGKDRSPDTVYKLMVTVLKTANTLNL